MASFPRPKWSFPHTPLVGLLLLVLTGSSDGQTNSSTPDEDRVVVSRRTFQEKLRGEKINRWRDFKRKLGPEAKLAPEVGGEERFTSGLTIAFMIILTVLVCSIAGYAIFLIQTKVGENKMSTRYCAWVALGIVSLYAWGMYIFCKYAYSDPELRLSSYFLFGIVPFAISVASYIIAALVLDFIRSMSSDNGFNDSLFDRLNPWEEHFDGRLIFFFAVLPGVAMSLYLSNTVTTGFESAATHVDIICFALFVDLFRLFGHFFYLIAPVWSIGKDPRSISSRPGLAYVFQFLCLALFVGLGHIEACASGFILKDRTKIHTLASLTSYVFFPLSVYLSVANIGEAFDQFYTAREQLKTTVILLAILGISLLMLLVAVVFDIIDANVMGISGILAVVFFAAYRFSNQNILQFILILAPLAGLGFCVIMLASHYGDVIRRGLLMLLAFGCDHS